MNSATSVKRKTKITDHFSIKKKKKEESTTSMSLSSSLTLSSSSSSILRAAAAAPSPLLHSSVESSNYEENDYENDDDTRAAASIAMKSERASATTAAAAAAVVVALSRRGGNMLSFVDLTEETGEVLNEEGGSRWVATESSRRAAIDNGVVCVVDQVASPLARDPATESVNDANRGSLNASGPIQPKLNFP